MPPEYNEISIYDAPGVLIQQARSGLLTPTSVRRTFTAPEELTPLEREEFLAPSADTDPFTKMLLGVGGNPWFWLMFLTSPVGANAIRSGTSLFGVAKKFASQQKASRGIMDYLRSSLEMFRGTAIPSVSLGVSETLTNMTYGARAELLPARKALIEKLNRMAGSNKIKSLNPGDYHPHSKEHEIVRRWNTLAAVKAHGLDRPDSAVVPYLKFNYRYRLANTNGEIKSLSLDDLGLPESEGAKMFNAEAIRQQAMRENNDLLRKVWYPNEGGVQSEFTSKEAFLKEHGSFIEVAGLKKGSKSAKQPVLMDPGLLQRELEKFGPESEDFLEISDHIRKKAFVNALGDAEYFKQTGGFKPDRDKVARLAGSFSRYSNEEGMSVRLGATTLQGKEAILALLGHDRFNLLVRHPQDVREKLILDVLSDLTTPDQWGRLWGSRNFFEANLIQFPNGEWRPPPLREADVARNLNAAPWAATSAMEDRFIPLTEREMWINNQDLAAMREWGYLSPDGEKHAKNVVQASQEAFDNGKTLLGLRLDYDSMHERYLHNMHQATAYDTMQATPEMIAADRAAIQNLSGGVLGRKTVIGPGREVSISQELNVNNLGEDGLRMVTPGTIMDRTYAGEQSPLRQATIREVVIPGSLNNSGVEYMALYNSQIRAKEYAKWFAGSPVGKLIAKTGTRGSDFINRLNEFADFATHTNRVDMMGSMAKWLYATHLGVNVNSMILNLTQPFLLAATIGKPTEIIGAFADSFKDMMKYAELRAAKGARFLDPEEKLQLIKQAFPYANYEGRNLIGIGPELHDILDSQLTPGKGFVDRVTDMALKGFEKTEWFNRNTAAHLYARVARRHGGPINTADLQQFVLQTQFGQHELNTPYLFTRAPLNNVLLRQFMTFPLRSLTGVIDVFPRLGGEQNYMKGLARVALRGMGMSAFIYESGKALAGADLSRGLFASATTDLFGGERLLEDGNEWIPVPPVVDIPIDFLRAVGAGEMDDLGRSISRMVPGGVAINRALGVMPELPRSPLAGVPGSLQSTFADWSNPTPEGLVPVFKGDGTMIDMRSPSELVLRGLGADMGRWQAQGALDNFLVKQRDQILEARLNFMRQLAANDMRGAMRTKAEFERRFGLPLTINELQLRSFLKNRATSRTERVFQRIPSTERQLYTPYFEQVQENKASPVEEQEMHRRFAEMQRKLQAVGPAASQDSLSFSTFTSY